MKTNRPRFLKALLLLFLLPPHGALAETSKMSFGVFEDHGDIGSVLHAGSVEYDASKKTYAIRGSGENMWSKADAFHFVWKKVSGDATLTADISFLGEGKNPHRKAVLMVRQSLEADSAYADAALHGEGLTSLQYRDEKGATTHEVQANISAPKRLRLAKRGKYVYLLLGGNDEQLHVAGAAVQLALDGPFYIGIGVCSHEKDLVEEAVFSNIDLVATEPAPSALSSVLYSSLETVTVASTDRRVAYVAPEHFEAPNWLPNGTAFLFNSGGHILRLPVAGGKPAIVDTGFADRCNNDHGISPDGTQLAISDQSQTGSSSVYILPMEGGTPRPITHASPSYWHGWSPDGKTLAFVGQRNGEFDIYTIPATGGDETRLTTAKGLDDGPEYSPDGRYIYFNSERTGTMQIWRMRSDGAEQEQVTSDEFNNWFPHISPDGKWMVFLSYTKDVLGHPANKDVMLRLMPLNGEKSVTILAKLFGGQGTINVPSWSPDSLRLAFVSYELVPTDVLARTP